MTSARRAARSSWVGWLGRAGFAAQGTCFVVIAVLALELAFGSHGHLTDPRGAFVILAEDGWTRVLIVFLAIGFGCYSLWRPGAGCLRPRRQAGRGGAWIVGAIGAGFAVVAVVNIYWGLSGRFMQSLDQHELSSGTERLLRAVGTLGFIALGFVLGVIAWFMVKAAVDYNAGKVVSLGGAMAHLAQVDYGQGFSV